MARSARLALAAATLSALVASARVSAVNAEVIYGQDDRKEPFDPTVDPRFVTAARSTTALMHRSDVTADATDAALCHVPGKTFGDVDNLCPEEPFRAQPAAAFCSGFLVQSNIIVTAGHCVVTQSECETIAFVFGFALTAADKDPTRLATRDVYYCKRLVAHVQDPTTLSDFAVVELTRDVPDRAPLPYRKTGKIADGESVLVIGHPAGIPTKIAAGAHVRSNDQGTFFVANTDTYGGNSGSAVLNARTLEVEGILVRGENDFVAKGGCMVSNVCADDQCRGEDATRATEFAAVIPPPVVIDPNQPTRLVETHADALSLAIPDQGGGPLTYDLVLAPPADLVATAPTTIDSLGLTLGIKHPYVGDLVIKLVHPDGTTVTVVSQQGGNQHDLAATFGDGGQWSPDLAQLHGKPAFGTWHLQIEDRGPGDVGMLESVRLAVKIALPTTLAGTPEH